MGRPSEFTDELADEICERVLTRSIHSISSDDDMPCETTIYSWLARNESFAAKYARARGLRAFRRAEQVDDVVADLRAGEIDHNTARVQIDAIKWQTGKENPKHFGDKLELAGSADDPINVTVKRIASDA